MSQSPPSVLFVQWPTKNKSLGQKKHNIEEGLGERNHNRWGSGRYR